MLDVNALVIANSFLKLSFAEQNLITPMKLQKLIYFAYKKHLKDYEEKLFIEPFMKWKYGPVLESVYNAYKKYGSNPISQYSNIIDGSVTIINLDVNSSVSSSIFDTWIKYRKYPAWELSALTHGDNTAWSKAYDKLNDEDIYNEPEFK